MVEYNENGYSRNRRGGCGMDSFASVTTKWRAVVNTVTNLWVP